MLYKPFQEAVKLLLGRCSGYLVNKLAVFKEDQGGDTFYLVLGSCHLIAAGIELGDYHPSKVLFRHGIYMRSQHSAWAAGRRKEIHHNRF